MGVTDKAPLSSSTELNGLGSARHSLTGTGGLGSGRVLEIQRSRILAAMVDVSAELGAGNVTVAHIVARAGVSRRTFYELFADREACVLGGFDEGIARASRYVLDAYDPSAKWVERLRTALTCTLSFLDQEHGLAQLLIVGSLGAGSGALERRKRVLARMIDLVDEGRDETKAGSQLPSLTAEGIVGGVLSVIHSRLLDGTNEPLLYLTGPLMSMIVLPYLGAAAARRELTRPVPISRERTTHNDVDPLRDLGMRLTYRTVRVLLAVAAIPGGSNRQLADASEVSDQGQISKLLRRLQGLGLVENTGGEPARGGPNAWILTSKGWKVEQALNGRS